MKISRFLLPSFDMQVKTYQPESSIKLIGENNWWQMLWAYGLIVLLAVTFTMYLESGEPLLVLLPLSIVFVYSMDNVRSSSYLKQEITFDEYGILLKHSKDLDGSQQIKPSQIQKIYMTTKGSRIKFFLNDAARPTFQFSSIRLSRCETKIFVQDVARLLGLEVKNYRQFKERAVFELVNPVLIESACDLPIEKECLLANFFIERVGSELIVNKVGGWKGVKKVLSLRLIENILTYHSWYLRKQEIAFRDIRKFDYKVFLVHNRHENKVYGRLYLVSRSTRARILSVSKTIGYSKVLAQFKMEEDLKRLKEILEAEI